MSGYDYAYAPYGAGASGTSEDDMYAPFYRWDASASQWSFDYDGFYQMYGYYPQAEDSSHGGGESYGYAGNSTGEGSSSYALAAAATAGESSTASQGGKAPRKKWIPGPKDAEGNPIAGHLKKGETRKTVLRKAAGKVWEDPTLLEWDPCEYRKKKK